MKRYLVLAIMFASLMFMVSCKIWDFEDDNDSNYVPPAPLTEFNAQEQKEILDVVKAGTADVDLPVQVSALSFYRFDLKNDYGAKRLSTILSYQEAQATPTVGIKTTVKALLFDAKVKQQGHDIDYFAFENLLTDESISRVTQVLKKKIIDTNFLLTSKVNLCDEPELSSILASEAAKIGNLPLATATATPMGNQPIDLNLKPRFSELDDEILMSLLFDDSLRIFFRKLRSDGFAKSPNVDSSTTLMESRSSLRMNNKLRASTTVSYTYHNIGYTWGSSTFMVEPDLSPGRKAIVASFSFNNNRMEAKLTYRNAIQPIVKCLTAVEFMQIIYKSSTNSKSETTVTMEGTRTVQVASETMFPGGSLGMISTMDCAIVSDGNTIATISLSLNNPVSLSLPVAPGNTISIKGYTTSPFATESLKSWGMAKIDETIETGKPFKESYIRHRSPIGYGQITSYPTSELLPASQPRKVGDIDKFTDTVLVLEQQFSFENPAPIVSGINPNTAFAGAVTSAAISGQNFQNGAIISLSKSGEASITGTAVNVTASASLTCSFDLNNVATGTWDLVIENPDGLKATLPGAFTVQTASPTIYGIDPARVLNSAPIENIKVNGSNFRIGAKVILIGDNGLFVEATETLFISKEQLVCKFDSASLKAGVWSVKVVNLDQKLFLAANIFTVLDGAIPAVLNVSSSSPDKTYVNGDKILIDVKFDRAVRIEGSDPILLMEVGDTDRQANYTSGNNTDTLQFTYAVQVGDVSSDLDYVASNSLVANSAVITDLTGIHALLILPEPGTAGSLAANKAIVIDAELPKAVGVNATTADGAYKAGDTVNVTVGFNKLVNVTGTPKLVIETGDVDRDALYLSGTGSSTLTFAYTVQAGDYSEDLDYVDANSLSLNGGTIKDALNRDVILTLPAPGAPGSLGSNKAITVRASLVSSAQPNSGETGTVVSSVQITGKAFSSGATTKLTRSGQAFVAGTNVSVNSNTSITCSFDLTGLAVGSWNVEVTNSDGETATGSNIFSVVSSVPAPWKKSLGGSSGEADIFSVATTDNCYLVAGTTSSSDGSISGYKGGANDIWVAKIDKAGTILWSKCFGGSGSDYCGDLIAVSGGYVFAGTTNSTDGDLTGIATKHTQDAWVVKIDLNGNIVSQSRFGHSDGFGPSEGRAVISTSDGGYALAGYTDDGGYQYGWAVKINSSFTEVWQKQLTANSGMAYANDIAQKSNGNLLLCGYTEWGAGDFNAKGFSGGEDGYVFELANADGTVVQGKCYGGTSNDRLEGLLLDSSGQIYAIGSTGSSDGTCPATQGGKDAMLLKIQSDLTLTWAKNYGGSADDYGYGVKLAPDSTILWYGKTASTNGDVSGNNGANDMWFGNSNTSGALVWNKCYGGTADDLSTTLVSLSSGEFVFAGYGASDDGDFAGTGHQSGNNDFVVIRDTSLPTP